MPTTTIQSNGSKWMGQEPDDLETLFKILETVPLRREFAWNDYPEFQAFVNSHPLWISQDYQTDDGRCYIASDKQPEPGTFHIHGNFYGQSHVFSIYTDDPELIRKFSSLIRANLRRADYKSQEPPGFSMGPHFIIYPDGSKKYWKGGKYYKRKPK